jgi:hypothetical protein
MLFNDEYVKWNNKCLNLNEIEKQEIIYEKIFKEKYK